MEERVLSAIKNWLNENRKIFWKYEVACFYRTYQISIGNMPEPTAGDIKVLNGRNLMNDEQKNRICDVIRKAYSSIKNLSDKLDVILEINYRDGNVDTEIIKSRSGGQAFWKKGL